MNTSPSEPMRYRIIGAGKSGVSVLKHLLSLGHEVAINDTRLHPENQAYLQKNFPDVPKVYGRIDPPSFEDAWVVSPGISPLMPQIAEAKKDGMPLINDLALWIKDRPQSARIVGITGTNGKSFVATLLAHILKQSGIAVRLLGNIGTPFTDEPLKPNCVYVLELSSFQLEYAPSLFLDQAVVLNIEPDHLPWHGSFDAYTRAKRKIFQGAKHVVSTWHIPQSFPEEGLPQKSALKERTSMDVLVKEAEKTKALHALAKMDTNISMPILSPDAKLFYGEESINLCVPSLWMDVDVQNTAIAVLMARRLGASKRAIEAALPSAPVHPHRAEILGVHAGMLVIDNSKATNIPAAKASIHALAFDKFASQMRRVAVIVGGDAKGQKDDDFASLAHEGVFFVGIGKDGMRILRALDPKGTQSIYQHTLENAMAHIATMHEASPFDALMLAPACASLDQYPNQQKRGEAFQALLSVYF